MRQLIGEGRSAQILAWDEGRVLKLYYDWNDRNAVQREYDASMAAYHAGIPVPRPYEIVDYEGRLGIIFERIQGISGVALFRRRPWSLPALIRQIAALQARTLEAQVPGLPDVREHFDATIRRASQNDLPAALSSRILERIQQLPADNRLCHMDFHPDNVMLTPGGWVIIDWMNARSGAALADVARSAVIYRVSGAPPGTPGGLVISLGGRLADIFYNREIRKLMNFAPEELDAWMLPAAAARLVEKIPGERQKLTAMVDRLMKK